MSNVIDWIRTWNYGTGISQNLDPSHSYNSVHGTDMSRHFSPSSHIHDIMYAHATCTHIKISQPLLRATA